jgi:hypothetical protein
MVQREGTRTRANHDHKHRSTFCGANGHDSLHGTLRVSGGTREIGGVENGSNANSLGMGDLCN